jgi:hypothetical protein
MKVLKDRGYEYGEHWGRTTSRTASLLLMRSHAKSWRARVTRSTVRCTHEFQSCAESWHRYRH